MTTFSGQCHCGNLRYELETTSQRDEIVARACDCGFCRMHASKTWSDPHGHALVTVSDPTKLQRYRFGLKAIDFYICTECGGYAGAVLDDEDGTWVTLNLRLSDHAGIPEGGAHYDNQSGAERVARRKKMWTPATVEGLD